MHAHAPSGGPNPPKIELIPGIGFLLVALVCGALGLNAVRLPNYGAQLCCRVAVPLFLLAAAFLSTYFTASARLRGQLRKQTFIRRGGRPLHPVLERLRGYSDSARVFIANMDWQGAWLPLILILVGTGVALYLEYRGWKMTAALPTARLDQWLFGSLLALCFPVLVLERRFTALTESHMLGAQAFSLLLRLLLGNLLLFALGFLLRWLQLPWWSLLDHAAMLFTALAASELLLRAASYIFMPLPPLEARRGHADSLVAGLLRLERPSLSALSASISREIGIDLGRSWALGFVRRAALPTAIGLAVAGWLMTGLTALDLSQRAVYEAFGEPKAVFHSGLHIHLPWPLGRLTMVEYGVIHEIPIVFASESSGGEEEELVSTPVREVPTIEGPPPQASERLWDASHPSEASYLVASNRNGRETFEVVNIDLQILYRIGLSDQAAYNSVYNVEAPDSLIRAAAGRMLARYFARYTIPDVLGQNREQFIRGFQRELQSRLNALSSGIDVLGVVVEAIHPPAGAATAYQNVQAAGIRSEIQVATARGAAVRSTLQAQAQAITMRDDAQANAAEAINQAKRDTALFAGDVTAYHQDGAAFLFERRIQVIGKAVKPDLPLTILDSRIPANQMPLLDLRPPGSANTPVSGGAGPPKTMMKIRTGAGS